MTSFKRIADEIAARIQAGLIKPGERLPTLRNLAYKRGIANSTASRVYSELLRRGLTTGEVGRGTFVRQTVAPVEPMLIDPSDREVDLELNFPILPQQSDLLAQALRELAARPDARTTALRPVGAAGTAAARITAASFLARDGWRPDPASMLFAGNGKQALAAAVTTLVGRGERLGVEALTYPVIKTIATRQGIDLVPIAMDEFGLVPDALAAAHRQSALTAVYVQPTLHNPLGVTMPEARRRELARILVELHVPAIEDAVYGFLADGGTPIVALAPEWVIHVDSLSKRIAPGLTVGMIAAPLTHLPTLASALRAGVWTASGFALEMGVRWMADGTASALEQAKRQDAVERQKIARKALAGLELDGDRHAYHLWLTLPEPWRSERFVAAAGRRGIAVTPSAAFAAGPGHAPNAVRLALASPTPVTLASALNTLAALARSELDPWATE